MSFSIIREQEATIARLLDENHELYDRNRLQRVVISTLREQLYEADDRIAELQAAVHEQH
jgi:hypothetical protein